jgi:hypothetical protein
MFSTIRLKFSQQEVTAMNKPSNTTFENHQNKPFVNEEISKVHEILIPVVS